MMEGPKGVGGGKHKGALAESIGVGKRERKRWYGIGGPRP